MKRLVVCVWCVVCGVWCVGVFWCLVCLVWFGLVWFGLVWFGVVWCGLVWCGVVWCGALPWHRRMHCSGLSAVLRHTLGAPPSSPRWRTRATKVSKERSLEVSRVRQEVYSRPAVPCYDDVSSVAKSLRSAKPTADARILSEEWAEKRKHAVLFNEDVHFGSVTHL